jgi:hypothetical protein
MRDPGDYYPDQDQEGQDAKYDIDQIIEDQYITPSYITILIMVSAA